MKLRPALLALGSASLFASLGVAAPSTGSPFYGDAPDAHHPWAIHDQNRPQPPRVEPGTFSTASQPGQPPSDAIVLFDGTAASLAKWESDPKPGEAATPTKWVVRDGALECVPKAGYIRTKEQFGDCQLHVEWAAPKAVQGASQGRGNSGIFLLGRAEVVALEVKTVAVAVHRKKIPLRLTRRHAAHRKARGEREEIIRARVRLIGRTRRPLLRAHQIGDV